MRAFARACLGCSAVALLVAVSRDVRGDVVEACVSAVEEGQKLERAGQLRGARARFLSCDKTECPSEVRTVCDRLLNRVEGDLPTVIFAAKDAGGKDLIDVRVFVDGAAVAESMDGKAVPIDPGPHSIRFEHTGESPVEESVVVREAEKNRPIVVSFAGAKGTPPPLGEGEVTTATRRPVPALVFVLGGIGIASLGVFAGLDASGQSRYASCQGTPCSASTVHSLSIERDVTFVVGGVGLASLVAATALFFTRPAESRASAGVRFEVDALRSGGLIRALGSF
jgi:hypothetical protein